MKTFTPNATIKGNIPAWEDGQPVFASAYQPPVNKGVDGIRPETYLVEVENGIKQRISVRNVEFKKDTV